MCFSLLSCLGRASNKSKTQHDTMTEKTHLLRPSSPQSSPEQIADNILDILFRASSNKLQELNSTTLSLAYPRSSTDLADPVRTTGWYEAIAKRILWGMEQAVKSGISFGETMGSAIERARAGADEFVREHPIWTGVIVTVIALAALYLLVPWVIEALGFTEVGPLAGSWAAAWQSSIGDVEAGSLFAFLQRLGAVGWKGVSAM